MAVQRNVILIWAPRVWGIAPKIAQDFPFNVTFTGGVLGI
jgi:hypothetical protein